MMIVIVLLLALVVGVLLNGRQGVVQADTKAVAEALVASLKAARQQAVTQAHPVAVVLPSQSGSKPHSQGYSLVEGYSPALTSVNSFQHEHPETCLAVGLIGSDSTIDRPRLDTVGQFFDPAPWFLKTGRESDYIFCFLPDGSVVTNDLPLSSGAYNILVTAGIEYSGASAPSGQGWGVAPSYFSISKGSSLRVVSISPLGDISLHKEAPGVQEEASLEFSTAPASLPAANQGAGTTAPDLVQIEVTPRPDPATLPPGIEALVDVNGHLSLRVVVRGENKSFYCRWSSDRGGPFSRPEQHPMQWEQDAVGAGEGAWVSRVEWRPPPGATGGEIYELSVEVTDPDGGVDQGRIGATGQVQTVQRSKILFQSTRGGVTGLYSMLSDGSDVTLLFPGRNGILSPAGDQVFYARNDTLYLKPIGSEGEIELITMPPEPYDDPNSGMRMGKVRPNCINARGDLLFWTVGNSTYVAEFNGFSQIVPHRLNDDPGFVDIDGDRHIELKISPDGNYIAYDDGFRFYVAEFDQEGPPYVTGGNQNLSDTYLGGDAAGNPTWGADGRKLFYHQSTGPAIDLGVFDFDPTTGAVSNPRFLTNSPATEDQVSVSPSGSEMVYTRDQGGQWDIIKSNIDGSNPVNLTGDNPGDDVFPIWGQ